MRQRIAPGCEAKIQIVVIAHASNVQGLAVVEHRCRIQGLHLGAKQVKLLLRAGHIGDGDVEHGTCSATESGQLLKKIRPHHRHRERANSGPWQGTDVPFECRSRCMHSL